MVEIKAPTPLNNFDIIRLFAALQVAITHTARHLNVELPVLFQLLSYFPGVPIFFFISGYLIYQSYSKIQTNKLQSFFTNRFLRLYPALFFCYLITTLSLYFCGYLQNQDVKIREFVNWALASLTFFQFYNPEFLRSYGVGAINGSLWTISVELQFYILTPLLYILYRKHKWMSITLVIIFILINIVYTFHLDRSGLANKIFGVSFAPWFYMFMIGAYISTNKYLQERILFVDASIYLGFYLLTYLLASYYNLGVGNGINFISYIFLCLLVFKLAYTRPTLSHLLLGGNDVSYGVYIYHMPVVNLWLFYDLKSTTLSFLTAISVVLCISLFSWRFIEKPSLKLKKISLRSYI